MRSIFQVLFLILIFSIAASAQSTVDHWETVVYDSSIWHYWPGTSAPGNGWNTLNFDDSAWPTGRGSIGYGDNDDRTVTDVLPSVFLRRKFQISNLNDIKTLFLNIDYDDGFIAYINGSEVSRANMDPGPAAFDQSTPTDHEAVLYQGIPADRYEISTQYLVSGENIITVEVHNHGITSSDMTSAVFLTVGVTTATQTYGPTPSWFVPPLTTSSVSSNLPVIVIDTHGQNIISDVQITADMGLIDNGAGQRNKFSDAFNNYNGKITIEVHGESSQGFPKKSYHIETVDIAGDNLDASLAGLPEENDWILYAPYSDKSLLRNMLAYTYGAKLGRYYAPRFKFVEMILNGNYNGLYMLVEKIKQDKNRVNISKLKATDVAGDAVTGGYILRVDKIDPDSYPSWAPQPSPAVPGEANPTFQYQDPKGDKLVDEQRNYIKTFITQMESNLSSNIFTDSVKGISKFIDVNSFTDFMLISEVSKSVDAYVYSTYMYKDRDSKGGKLTMGPLWDFDLAYGNVDYNTNSQFAPGWTYSESYRMFWFRRLMTSQPFKDSLKCRWNQLRTSYFSDAWVSNTIDSMTVVLKESQFRNFQQWPVLGVYIWPNQFVGQSWKQETDWLKTWITTRLDWMDANLPGTCPGPAVVTGLELHESSSASLFPNPTNGGFKIQFQTTPPAHSRITIYSMLGQPVAVDEVTVGQDLIYDTDAANLYTGSSGVYIVEVRSAGKVILRTKLVRR